MYGGALPVAKSRKTKRKTLTKAEYLDDALEVPQKKKTKKAKVASKVEVTGPSVSTIQEEVQDLDAGKVVNKRTRSGKSIGTSQTQPPQLSIPKKKKKLAIRKLKIADYVTKDE
jgi:predicted XRE-type DNA-binding protein